MVVVEGKDRRGLWGASWRAVVVCTGARLACGCGRAYRVRMTTPAKFVWILIAVMLMLWLLGALASTLISPA